MKVIEGQGHAIRSDLGKHEGIEGTAQEPVDQARVRMWFDPKTIQCFYLTLLHGIRLSYIKADHPQ